MIYELRLTVPKNTLAAAPVSGTLVVHPGVVKEVNVLFPRRCAQLMHVQIFHWSNQVWPSYADQSITGDGETVDWVEEYHVAGPPFEFIVRAWNDDDTFGHTVTVRMVVLSPDTSESGGVLKQFVEFFGKLGRGEL